MRCIYTKRVLKYATSWHATLSSNFLPASISIILLMTSHELVGQLLSLLEADFLGNAEWCRSFRFFLRSLTKRVDNFAGMVGGGWKREGRCSHSTSKWHILTNKLQNVITISMHAYLSTQEMISETFYINIPSSQITLYLCVTETWTKWH